MISRLPPTIRLMGFGFYVAACIVGGVLGGLQLDGLLDTGRLFAVLGLFVGLAVAFTGAYLLLMEVLNKRG